MQRIKITLKTKTNKKAEDIIKNLKGGSVKVGWYEGQKEPNGLLVAENAFMQENGFFVNGKYVEPRPFMQITMNENKNKWQAVWKKLYKSVLDGKRTLKQALDLLGFIVKKDIQNTLISGRKLRKNEKSTLKAKARKGSPLKPLLDSLTMLKTINFESKEHK